MKCLTRGAAKAAGVALTALVLGGCAMERAPAEPDTLVLFGNGQAAGLRVQLGAPGGQIDLTGASVSTPNTAKAGEPPSDANLRRTPRRADADALEMRWQNTWFTSLRLVADRPMVLTIFPRDEQPNTLLRRLNNRVNERITGLHDGRDVFFLDINASLMNADGTISRDVMPDLLHLSEKGYRQWARAIVPTLERLLSLP
jgi:lysophospholipase L1-like esterase